MSKPPDHDTEHGWCICGEWHEQPGEFQRRFGSREAGLMLVTYGGPIEHVNDPVRRLAIMRRTYAPFGV